MAYGVLPKNKFIELLGKDNFPVCNLNYKKNYRLEDNQVVATYLKNKK